MMKYGGQERNERRGTGILKGVTERRCRSKERETQENKIRGKIGTRKAEYCTVERGKRKEGKRYAEQR